MTSVSRFLGGWKWYGTSQSLHYKPHCWIVQWTVSRQIKTLLSGMTSKGPRDHSYWKWSNWRWKPVLSLWVKLIFPYTEYHLTSYCKQLRNHNNNFYWLLTYKQQLQNQQNRESKKIVSNILEKEIEVLVYCLKMQFWPVERQE